MMRASIRNVTLISFLAVGIVWSQGSFATPINLAPEFTATADYEIPGFVFCFQNFWHLTSIPALQVGPDDTGCDSEKRGVVEFDISSIADSNTVDAAMLSLTRTALATNVPVDVHGYVGDGVLSISDVTMVDNLLADIAVAAPGTYDVDVTGFVRSLVDSNESFAGFLLDCSLLVDPGPGTQFCLGGSPGLPTASLPVEFTSAQLTLDITGMTPTSVPEPGSLGLFALGLFGVALARRKAR